LADQRRELEEPIRSVLDNYAWFLEQTARDPAIVGEWLAEPKGRDDAFDKARTFGRTIFKLVQETPQDPDRLRYLVV
jgi:hypothetical protein